MKDANIERLLGGYATNTLTDTERNALFKAALEDQELFNALQDEEALRDLLEDVDSRRTIERALKQPVEQPRRSWSPKWAWGLAGSAVVAGGLIFAVLPLVTSHDEKLQMAVSKPAHREIRPDVATDAVPVPVPARENPARLVHRKPADPQAAPSAKSISGPPGVAGITPDAQQVIAQIQQPQLLNRLAKEAASPSAAVPAQAIFRASAAGYASGSGVSADAVAYSVMKRGEDDSFAALTPGEELKAGDSVRLMLLPPRSGSLVLQEEMAGGNWKTIYPAEGLRLPVAAQREVIVPDSPIQVDGPKQLRLVFIPTQLPASVALSNAAKSALTQDKRRLESTQVLTEAQSLEAKTAPGVSVTLVRLAPGRALQNPSLKK